MGTGSPAWAGTASHGSAMPKSESVPAQRLPARPGTVRWCELGAHACGWHGLLRSGSWGPRPFPHPPADAALRHPSRYAQTKTSGSPSGLRSLTFLTSGSPLCFWQLGFSLSWAHLSFLKLLLGKCYLPCVCRRGRSCICPGLFAGFTPSCCLNARSLLYVLPRPHHEGKVPSGSFMDEDFQQCIFHPSW